MTYLHHVCRQASTMFEDIIIPCFHNIWRHAFKYIKTLYTIFGDIFTSCLKAFLHHLWRNFSHCFIHIYILFEDMFIQCLRIWFYKMFEAIFIQNWWLGSCCWKWMKNSKYFVSEWCKFNHEGLKSFKTIWNLFIGFKYFQFETFGPWTFFIWFIDLFQSLKMCLSDTDFA